MTKDFKDSLTLLALLLAVIAWLFFSPLLAAVIVLATFAFETGFLPRLRKSMFSADPGGSGDKTASNAHARYGRTVQQTGEAKLDLPVPDTYALSVWPYVRTWLIAPFAALRAMIITPRRHASIRTCPVGA